MPNWCNNKLTIRGTSGVLECLEAIKGEPNEDGPVYIDFQRIVPMPAILDQTESGSNADMGRVLFGDDVLGEEMLSYSWARGAGITDLGGLRSHIREKYPEAEEAGKRAIHAKQKTGCYDWYEWRVGTMENLFKDGHWGTKWNVCYAFLDDGPTDTRANLAFDTAWSPPIPVIIQLSKQFPKLAFTLKYWEGGCGFRGILRVKAGNVQKNETYNYSGGRKG